MRRALTLIFLTILAAGCSSKHDNSPKLPSTAALIFPDNNAACITGTVISPTQNTIPFSWHTSANTNSYELVVKNLLTSDSTTYSGNTPGITATLLQNTPYSWYVISKSNSVSTTAKSSTWKFYNSGPGALSYPPFPAELLSPTFAQLVNASGGKVTLTWDCTDPDDDLVSYDVYFGTSSSPSVLQSNVTNKTLDVTVTSGTTYYWMIVAKDAKGNTSTSEVFQFKVN